MEDRKLDHINLAFESAQSAWDRDMRFNYEPLLAGHPTSNVDLSLQFLNKTMRFPLWVSSMTGGTAQAKHININLAKACHAFGLGMGLGSCRKMISNPESIPDFQMRSHIGNHLPLYANIGIAQLEEWLYKKQLHNIHQIIELTEADGLIIHVNPIQEWVQPEGDRILHKPLDIINDSIAQLNIPIIVKEVGQGMGPLSVEAILSLPIAAFETAAFGGTNFAKLEQLRSSIPQWSENSAFTTIGHSLDEMLYFINTYFDKNPQADKQIILSGGVKDFLDGYYANQKCKYTSVYGHASAFLKYASISYEALCAFIQSQIDAYSMASQFLRVKS